MTQGTRNGEEKYISLSNNAYNTVWTYALSDISAIQSATDYVFSMDFALTRCNAGGTTILQIFDGSDTEIFKVSATGADPGKGSTDLVTGSVYTSGGNEAETETVTMNTFRGGALTWYNIKIVSNSTDGTTLTLTKCDNAQETKTYTLSNQFTSLGKIVADPANANQTYYGGASFDNFIFQTPDDGTVSEPTASIVDLNGDARTIQLECLTDGATIYYNETTDEISGNGWQEYTAAFSTKADPIYVYAKKGNKESTVAKITTDAGKVITLGKPTVTRTGAQTYRIEETTTSAYGITAKQTIHYTINGGTEQTAASPASLTNVDGDIIAWAVADKFGNSEQVEVSYVAAIATADDAWSYNLNSYPSAHTCTAIANAITGEGETLNGLTVYNLKDENLPNLYVENSQGWLLRNQSSNAWKAQTAAASIVINNVTASNLISVNASNDTNTKDGVSNVTNGEIKYQYYHSDFFIVPTTDGAVTITFPTGTSVNTITVYNTSVSPVVTDYATFSSPYALDFTEATGVKAYTATISEDGGKVMMKKVTTAVPANTGLFLQKDGEDEVSIPTTTTASAVDGDNLLKATTGGNIFNNAKTQYVFATQNGVDGFYKVTSDLTVAAGKAYLEVANAEAGARLSIVFEGETTGITVVEKEAATEAIYNLNGQRVQNATKGLYIVNGKKVIKK